MLLQIRFIKCISRHYFWGFLFLNIFSCQNKETKESTPTMGTIRIASDSQLREIMQQEEDIFERNYKHANIELVYTNESSVIKLLKEDSIKTAITCRNFNDAEIKYFNSKLINPRAYPFAKGALALICNNEVRDTGILYENFINLLSGTPSENSGFKIVVIEDVASGIAQFLLDKIQIDHFSDKVYTLENKDSIFNYLNENKHALAVVDWSEFSDSDNSMQQLRLKNFKILGISRPKDSLQLGYLSPDQYQLQDDKYPLTRTFYILSVSGKSDLGVGFASFITGELGQRILLKAGLLPQYQSERWIELKDGSFNVVE